MVDWSNGEYKFESATNLDSKLKPNGGVYVISRKESDGHIPLYVGEAELFSKRIVKEHEKWNCWHTNSKSYPLYISLHIDNSGLKSRESKETEIRHILKNDKYSLPCNKQ